MITISSTGDSKPLLTAICVLWCMKKSAIAFGRKDVQSLFIPLLTNLIVSDDAKHLAEYEEGCQILKNTNERYVIGYLYCTWLPMLSCIYTCRKEVCQAIQRLMRESSANLGGLEWLNGLPIYNLLMGHSEPLNFNNIANDGKLIDSWNRMKKELSLDKCRLKANQLR